MNLTQDGLTRKYVYKYFREYFRSVKWNAIQIHMQTMIEHVTYLKHASSTRYEDIQSIIEAVDNNTR